MKKTIALIALTGLLFISCKKEENAAPVKAKNPDEFGVIVKKSANIEMVKKMTAMATSSDFENFKANFAPNAVIHDNMKDITVDENINILKEIKSKGMTLTLEKDPLIFEHVNYEANKKTGINNYVFTYQDATFTKGGKSVVINYHMVFGIKDGKIAEEWDIYDTAPIMELLK